MSHYTATSHFELSVKQTLSIGEMRKKKILLEPSLFCPSQEHEDERPIKH